MESGRPGLPHNIAHRHPTRERGRPAHHPPEFLAPRRPAGARRRAGFALMERKIGFRVLAGQGANIDTTTAGGRLVFGIFAALAEFERELIRERTIAGLSSARARGRNGGRPYTITPASSTWRRQQWPRVTLGRRPVQGIGGHAPDALSLRRPQGRTATRRREAPRSEASASPLVKQ